MLSLLSLSAETEATFVLPLNAVEATEDDDAELTCDVSKPNAVVKWFKNGVEITGDLHVGIEAVGTKRLLKIHRSLLEDTATYQCQLVSSGASSQAELTIKGWFLAIVLSVNVYLRN